MTKDNQENKIYSLKRGGKWWAVIDCGETKNGGMSIPIFTNHFKKDGKTYRWYTELFMPPDNLTDWQEINILTKEITLVAVEGNPFVGWEDKEDSGLLVLQRFAKLLGHKLTLQDVDKLIKK